MEMSLFSIKCFPKPDFQRKNIIQVYFKDISWTLSGCYTTIILYLFRRSPYSNATDDVSTDVIIKVSKNVYLSFKHFNNIAVDVIMTCGSRQAFNETDII